MRRRQTNYGANFAMGLQPEILDGAGNLLGPLDEDKVLRVGYKLPPSQDLELARLRVRLDPPARLDPVEPRHEDIHHDDVGARRAHLEQCVDRVVRDDELDVRAMLHGTLQRAQLQRVVVHDQDPHHPRHAHRSFGEQIHLTRRV